MKNNSLTVYLLFTGFISILGQVIILRELNVTFYGVELIYTISLSAWLLGTAAGTLTGKHLIYKSPVSLLIFFILFIILLPCDIIYLRYSRIIFGEVPGAYLPFGYQLIGILIAVFPLSALSGIMFQHAAGKYLRGNYSLAKAYAIESAGGIAGGLISTWLLFAGIQNLNASFICSLISIIPVLYYSILEKRRYFSLVSGVIIILLLVLSCFSSAIDFHLTKLNHTYLAATTDSPYGRISVISYQGQVSVFENDALSFETESTAAEEFVHMFLTQHSSPKKALVLGGGIEGTIYELLKYDSLTIDYIELNKKLIDVTKSFLPGDVKESLNSKKVNIVYSDPVVYLKQCGKYDVILVGEPEPLSGQTNRFYTKEFFTICSLHLNASGITGIRLKSAENLWTTQLTARNSSIYKALLFAFSDVNVVPGSTCILTASDRKIEKNPDSLSSRLAGRKLKNNFIIPEYIKYIYTNDRYAQVNSLLSGSNTIVNSDIKPVSYQYTTAIWLSKFFPDLNWINLSAQPGTISTIYLYCSALFLLFIFLMIRYFTRFSGIVLVFIAGFNGMILETITILHYQFVSGVLFQNIGILLTSFMAGLSAGAVIIDKAYHVKMNKWLFRALGWLLILLLLFLNYYFAYTIKASLLSGLWENSAILFFAGFLVAGIFAFSSVFNVKVNQDTVSSLYSADLIGGCAGSLLASIVLAPLIGIYYTAMLTGIISLLSLSLI